MLKRPQRTILCNLWLSLLLVTAYSFGQVKGGRVILSQDRSPETTKKPVSKIAPIKKTLSPKSKSKKKAVRSAKPVAPVLAEVEIRLSTGTGNLLVENTGERYRVEAGSIRLTLKPGLYTLLASSFGHLEQRVTVNLQTGLNHPLTISLSPALGYLSILPNMSRSVIKILGIGTFSERIDNLQLPPGSYSIEVSTPGYKTARYEAKVESLKKTGIPVILEKLMPARTGYAMTVWREAVGDLKGEYQLLQLSGASGETEMPSGMIAVTLFTDEKRSPVVNGMLPGLPCQIDFHAVDDVSRFAIDERPSTENQWSRLRLRIYPKKNKKEVKFILKWYAINDEDVAFLIPPNPPPPLTQHRVYVNAEKQFRLSYPLNWQESAIKDGICFAPNEGVNRADGKVMITHGVMLKVLPVGSTKLREASEQIVKILLAGNLNFRQQGANKTFEMGSREALTMTLTGISELTHQAEIVNLYLIPLRKQEVLVMAFIRPQKENHVYWGAFGKIIHDFSFY
jgi:hypothetical protein